MFLKNSNVEENVKNKAWINLALSVKNPVENYDSIFGKWGFPFSLDNTMLNECHAHNYGILNRK